MKVTVVRTTCLRSGQCTYMHPKVFKEGPDGFPVVLHDPVPPELEADAEDASEICPSGAIKLEK